MIYYSTIFLNFIFKSKKVRNNFNCMLFILYHISYTYIEDIMLYIPNKENILEEVFHARAIKTMKSPF